MEGCGIAELLDRTLQFRRQEPVTLQRLHPTMREQPIWQGIGAGMLQRSDQKFGRVLRRPLADGRPPACGQASHGRNALPPMPIRFVALNRKYGAPLAFCARLEAQRAARKILLDRRNATAIDRQLHGQRAILLIVIADHAQPVGAQPHAPGQVQHAVLLLGRVAAVEAQGTVTCRNRVLWQGHAIEEQFDSMQCGRLRICLDTPANALFGQQAGDKIHIRLAILHAVVTRRQRVQAGPCIVAPAPAGERRMAGEHGIHDLADGCITENATVPLLRQPPRPCRQANAIAGEAAIAVQPVHLAYQADPPDVAPLRIAGGQRCGPAQPRFAGRVRVGSEYVDVVVQSFGQRFASAPAFDQQKPCAGQFKPVQQRCILMRLQRVHMAYALCTTLAHFCAQEPSKGLAEEKSDDYENALRQPENMIASRIGQRVVWPRRYVQATEGADCDTEGGACAARIALVEPSPCSAASVMPEPSPCSAASVMPEPSVGSALQDRPPGVARRYRRYFVDTARTAHGVRRSR